jgi:5-formyltetrahydrofolate cyclo-ligase
MNLRREFEKLIEKKRVEITDAEKAISAAEAYIQAMLDAIKKLPKEDPGANPPVRPGSDVEKVRDAILQAGKPLHLSEIISALGRTDDAETKAKIAGLLGWYTSKGKVFTKTAPNTYGLVESAPPDLPSEFGSVE